MERLITNLEEFVVLHTCIQLIGGLFLALALSFALRLLGRLGKLPSIGGFDLFAGHGWRDVFFRRGRFRLLRGRGHLLLVLLLRVVAFVFYLDEAEILGRGFGRLTLFTRS